MSADEKFDAIVIGAGPAGAACAYALSRQGKSVLMIERGSTAGSKNVTGGRIYSYALEMLEPGLTKRAPLERHVIREQIMLLGANSAVTLDYTDYAFGGEIPQSYTVLRAPFDEWLAAEAEAQGTLLATGILVEGLLEEDGKIVGVKAGEDDMYADVVIAADGVNSLIAQQAGLFGDISAGRVGVGVKEIIELPHELIEARFNLRGDEGAARVGIGCTDGIAGGSFLYTNQESISLGIVFNPEQAGRSGRSIHEIFQDFKLHPAILPLIEGGKTVEYGAHLVPEAGLSGVPQKLYREGLIVVGDAAGFCMNTGTMIRGIDLAIVSGLAAAHAVLKAAGPAQSGQLYMQELQNLLLLPTMKVYENFHHILAIPRMVKEYPVLANDIFKLLFAVNGKLPEKMPKAMMNIVKQHISFRQLLADGWKMFKAV
ncbi:FAD-dependent oxidoreductase [Sporomusa sp.]|uniref:FAD-dependent oxidoreductase n=1 Tax=Sporomusa sp. TaxID=2078658 RepID=UPI002CB3A64F|nr:FAD-dependent oxidoreductase [Sporomusa sp.]HWR05740.1 FAD-dependent oxidoreductase [Sporomusa sp.]